MLKLGAFWKKTDRHGKTYMSGILDNDAMPHTQKIPVFLFQNTRKESDKHADYFLYLIEPQEEKQKKEKEEVPF